MGWLFQYDMLQGQTPAEYFTKHFSCESETARSTVLAAATVGGTVYLAIENHIKATAKRYVFCGVILFKNNKKDGFGYKDMDEGVGPCEVDCPDRIMRLLSPVEGLPNIGYAAEWRANVAAARAKRRAARETAEKLVPGAVIRLPEPVTFSKTSIIADAFKLIEFRKHTPIFSPLSHPRFRCRLTRRNLATAVIEPAASPQ